MPARRLSERPMQAMVPLVLHRWTWAVDPLCACLCFISSPHPKLSLIPSSHTVHPPRLFRAPAESVASAAGGRWRRLASAPCCGCSTSSCAAARPQGVCASGVGLASISRARPPQRAAVRARRCGNARHALCWPQHVLGRERAPGRCVRGGSFAPGLCAEVAAQLPPRPASATVRRCSLLLPWTPRPRRLRRLHALAETRKGARGPRAS